MFILVVESSESGEKALVSGDGLGTLILNDDDDDDNDQIIGWDKNNQKASNFPIGTAQCKH